MDNSLRARIKSFPFRLSVTDHCNLRCFFCSNEGMPLDQRNRKQMEYELFGELIKILGSDIGQVSLTGGEPTLHPQIGALVDLVNSSGIGQSFFHTNGIELTPELMNTGLKRFTKLAVSIHSAEYESWKTLTKGTSNQYAKLLRNLENLGEQNYGQRVEIKHVPIRGLNDSPEVIGATLDLCARYGFKFKFLNFEPIVPGQENWRIPLGELDTKLVDLGCQRLEKEDLFRGQKGYLPINRYSYKNTGGVAIQIGCGEEEVCRFCYDSNEIFINPYFQIKPCHVDNHTIDLLPDLRTSNREGLIQRIIESREFLKKSPGKDVKFWSGQK